MKLYKDKNYPIHKLHIKKNLFESNALLMKRENIERHYKYNSKELNKLNDELKFLNTVEERVVDKISAEQFRTIRMDTFSISPRKVYNSTDKPVIQKSAKQLRKENKAISMDNKQLRETIKEMTFKADRSVSMIHDYRTKKGYSNTNLSNTAKSFKPVFKQSSTTIMDSCNNSIERRTAITESITLLNSPCFKNRRDTSHQAKEIKMKILQQAKAKQHIKNQSSLTISSNTTTIDSHYLKTPQEGSGTLRSFVRKTTKYKTESKKEILDNLYENLSKKDGFNEDAKDAITSYLKTFTGFFER
jgi:hypothetical protein